MSWESEAGAVGQVSNLRRLYELAEAKSARVDLAELGRSRRSIDALLLGSAVVANRVHDWLDDHPEVWAWEPAEVARELQRCVPGVGKATAMRVVLLIMRGGAS